MNVASQCGFTPQYESLEKLWRTYQPRGLSVLGCPCDQFGQQEPGSNIEIATFCTERYDISFPMSAKLRVNGDDAHPLWRWMQQEKTGLLGVASIKWNFTKFLIGRGGQLMERFAPTTSPETIVPAIERALGSVAAAATVSVMPPTR